MTAHCDRSLMHYMEYNGTWTIVCIYLLIHARFKVKLIWLKWSDQMIKASYYFNYRHKVTKVILLLEFRILYLFEFCYFLKIVPEECGWCISFVIALTNKFTTMVYLPATLLLNWIICFLYLISIFS